MTSRADEPAYPPIGRGLALEVPEPILCSPYAEPSEHWDVREGEIAKRVPTRRLSVYYYRDPKAPDERFKGREAGVRLENMLVTRVRQRLAAWRAEAYPGATRTTLELLSWWRREGRKERLFFAQLEAAESIVFLTEARAELRQGLPIPRDEPSEREKSEGYRGFLRYACRMATGTGKTTVMGMLAAWSILNKVADRRDARFSDTVLVVCPNVTIRSRLGELDPNRGPEGEASIYRVRDLVPAHLMPVLRRGRVIVTNWHVFEPRDVTVAGERARVLKAGRAETSREKITITDKAAAGRGTRTMTWQALEALIASGKVEVIEEIQDKHGVRKQVVIESTRYVESDAALVARVLREAPGKRNLLVLNDEAHHAYRRRDEGDGEAAEAEDDDEEGEALDREATVWVSGLDRISKVRGVNFCVDLSATPFFIHGAGRQQNRVFPWIVSDFSLPDAIESGLVKIPQLAVRDSTGAAVAGYFNIWTWILPQLSPSERGGKKASPKPEAILKYAHHPIAMLAAEWEKTFTEWAQQPGDPRHPVFIIVCKDTQIARVVHAWLAEDRPPFGIPRAGIEGFRNNGEDHTIRVDSRVVHETDTGESKDDEARWMRFRLDTVGKTAWPTDRETGRPIYPDGFVELAERLGRPLEPPGRTVRCIVSVSMLTEGWDCNTVTHILGLRPFSSQLLCEQVVGRGLRRLSYAVGPDDKLTEEVAKVFGVPFEIVPYKARKDNRPPPREQRWHVHAVPEKAAFEIRFPRVEGYTQQIRSGVTVDWKSVGPLFLVPERIPPEVEVKASVLHHRGRPSLFGPGREEVVTLKRTRRRQELLFDLAAEIVGDYHAQKDPEGQPVCTVPAHVLFPQVYAIVDRYVKTRVKATKPAEEDDVFFAPYYGWLIDRLAQAIRADTSLGDAAEVPRYESRRGSGSTADVDFWTVREVREVKRSHVNYVAADTDVWEESAAYFLDHHPKVDAFVKNAGLGFAIPYLYDGKVHDYVPDFIVRLATSSPLHLILEVKGWDAREEAKRAGAERWVRAVNADGRHGRWAYEVARHPSDVVSIMSKAAPNGTSVRRRAS